MWLLRVSSARASFFGRTESSQWTTVWLWSSLSVADRGQQPGFEEGRPVEHHQRLVRVAGEDRVVEGLGPAVLVLDDDVRGAPMDLAHRPAEMDAVAEAGRQRLVDAPRAAAPGLHRGRGLDVEELEIAREQRRRHVEHVGRHQEVDEHRLQDLVAKIAREPAEIEHRPHADIVVRVERVEQPGACAVEPAEALHPRQQFLEFGDLRLQLAPDVGVEIVRVDAAAIAHAVAEPGIDGLDPVPAHQQHDVVVDRGMHAVTEMSNGIAVPSACSMSAVTALPPIRPAAS